MLTHYRYLPCECVLGGEGSRSRQSPFFSRLKRLLGVALSLAWLMGIHHRVPAGTAPGIDQARIDAAVAKGVKYLKAQQNKNATWGKGAVYAVGYTALPALTLLECGVAPQDPVIQKAALFVRGQSAKLSWTYEVALAILFLDRLGEARDRELIKSLALRLVAGQSAAGGWNYLAPMSQSKAKVPLTAGRDDNSNSQFAMLALWAARRHGVPTDPCLQLAYQRYLRSQHADGGWGYMTATPESTPAMTCVGLLGLAIGHGSAGKNAAAEDRAIKDGLRALGKSIGAPAPNVGTPPMENLYFLWSLERVAMLFNLKTIGGKDWYTWGAQILVPNQLPEGHWQANLYHGSAPTIDTCFALLFLKRSNLVQDLTENLQLFMPIRDPDAHKK